MDTSVVFTGAKPESCVQLEGTTTAIARHQNGEIRQELDHAPVARYVKRQQPAGD
jgi:hypothetical protein